MSQENLGCKVCGEVHGCNHNYKEYVGETICYDCDEPITSQCLTNALEFLLEATSKTKNDSTCDHCLNAIKEIKKAIACLENLHKEMK